MGWTVRGSNPADLSGRAVLRRGYAADRLLGLWVRIPPGHRCLCVCVVRYRKKKQTRTVRRRDFAHASRPDLGPTQLPVQWVLGLFGGSKPTGAWP